MKGRINTWIRGDGKGETKMSKYKKGDRFGFEIEEVYTDCLDNDFYKIKNIPGTYSEGQLDMLKQVKPQSGKYDCSKALDFSHEQKRMCNDCECRPCPFHGKVLVNECLTAETQRDIDIVQAWSDSHPEEAPKHEKTLKEDFLEKFPNAQRDPNGIPRANPCDIYGNVKCSDFDCGSGECWSIPLSEVQKNEQSD